MHHGTRSVRWSGQSFRFERFPAWESDPDSLWAVSREGEFIGTMSCDGEITTSEFEVICQRWLTDLLGARAPERSM
jgi:hypothetical protein